MIERIAIHFHSSIYRAEFSKSMKFVMNPFQIHKKFDTPLKLASLGSRIQTLSYSCKGEGGEFFSCPAPQIPALDPPRLTLMSLQQINCHKTSHVYQTWQNISNNEVNKKKIGKASHWVKRSLAKRKCK